MRSITLTVPSWLMSWASQPGMAGRPKQSSRSIKSSTLMHVDGERAGLKFLCGAQAQAQLVNQLATLFDLGPDPEARPATGEPVAAEPAIDSEDLPQAASA